MIREFNYPSPLDLMSKGIRLVEVLDGPDDEPVSCALRYHSLDSCVPYTALSYKWGDVADSEMIYLDNKPFKAGRNLWEFLRRARRLSDRKFFWIDAISIDQENTEERNHQVALMREIYSKASEVAVWLGPADKGSDLAMKRINKARPKNCNKGFKPIWTREEGKAIFALYDRGYWRRIWIVQEFILAKEVILYCGEMIAKEQAIASVSDQLEQALRSGRIQHHPFAEKVLYSFASDIIRQRNAWKELPDEAKGFTLTRLLQISQHMESADNRDRVYGLLSLINGTEVDSFNITADYSKTPLDIYRQLLQSLSSRKDMPSSHVEVFAQLLRQVLGLDLLNLRVDGVSNKLFAQEIYPWRLPNSKLHFETPHNATTLRIWGWPIGRSTNVLRSGKRTHTKNLVVF
ncbi:HET-domain-containing protein [Zopfia rhizophila CBS 207.26]|uniref:HET-domain-containing protein n=1 Tax=Zopfia rhizophila CBS 207.26 TaxID=1314779 RepID=A0A6A6DWH8_9PEZI|nr:HET-domain-containing protein [Zopfia rhizophila CBS 207.26]